MKGYTVLGALAGNGINLYPFKEQCLGNIEIRNDYLISGKPIQWHLNFPDIPMLGMNELPINWSPDIIIGNPKCGLSSILSLSRGKTFKSPKDEPSLNSYIYLINYYEPKYFFLENLPKLLETYPPSWWDEYFINYNILAISDSVSIFGNSQLTRKRLLIIGTRKDQPSLVSQIANLYSRPRSLKTTKKLLENLPQNGHFREPLNEIVAIYGGRKMSFKEIQKYWQNNPTHNRFKTNNHLNSAPGVYRNLENEFPFTVRKGNREFNPEGLPMSPRERARIQGIPDDFQILDPTNSHLSFKTLLNKARITIANSPPYEIGLWIKSVCDNIFL